MLGGRLSEDRVVTMPAAEGSPPSSPSVSVQSLPVDLSEKQGRPAERCLLAQLVVLG